MELLAAVIFVCFVIDAYLKHKDKRKVAYILHIQERTEEAETLDFAVHLFEDEGMLDWQKKMEQVYSIAETRRSFNNKRMMAEYEKIKAQAEAQK